MKRQLRSLYISSNSVLSRFGLCSVSVKCRLIDSFSLNFYCSYLWCNFNKASISKMRVAYNNIYRRILGYNRRDSASLMFATHGIDSFEARARKVCYGFRNRLELSSNAIVLSVLHNASMMHTYIHQHWNQCCILILVTSDVIYELVRE